MCFEPFKFHRKHLHLAILCILNAYVTIQTHVEEKTISWQSPLGLVSIFKKKSGSTHNPPPQKKQQHEFSPLK